MSAFFIQAIGFVGLGLFILSYQIKSNRALFLCQMLGCLLFGVQFFLLGAYTGAFGLLINTMRNVLLLKANDWKWAGSKLTLCVILLLLAAMTAYTWDGWISLLPFVSVAVTTIGYWTRNAQKIRLSQLCGAPLTLIYDTLIRSWAGALNEGISILSILISIARFGWKDLGQINS